MEKHSSTPKKYPSAPDEIGQILGLKNDGHKAEEVHDTHAKTASGPAHLPVIEARLEFSKSHCHEEKHGDGEVDAGEKPAPVWLRGVKTAVPYAAVFAVGLALYYFFLSGTDFSSALNKIKSTSTTAETPKETALEELIKNSTAQYNTWIAQYYFEVNDPAIIDPKADNSGNGLSNFHKFLLNLNPRAYDTLSLGMADSQALAMGINPNTGVPLTDAQKSVIDKYFDMESIINRLTLNMMQGRVAGSSTQGSIAPILYNQSNQNNSNSVRGSGVLVSQVNVTNAATPSVLSADLDIDQNKPGLLEVPSLKISVPLIWTQDPKNFDKDLQSGVVHYPGTAMPGQLGTAYISGHSSNYAWAKGSYNRIFSKLGDLPSNASFSITVYLKDGKTVKLHYVASSRKEFLATDQEQFKNTGVSTVALSTCWPVNTTQRRLVVFGELTQIER